MKGIGAGLTSIILVIATSKSALAMTVRPPDRRAFNNTIYACLACHDHGGNSHQSGFPRIAGQQKAYLETTLKAFRQELRKEPEAVGIMWGMMQNQDDATITQLAEYFSSVRPLANKKGDSVLAEKGRIIFSVGAPERGIPACASCHGVNGEGTVVAPRLAAQHKSYTLKQFKAFRDGDRTEAQTMPAFVNLLDNSDEQALAAYLQGS